MSLDQLVQKTITSRTIRQAQIFLPPEYELTLEEWRDRFQVFNNHPKCRAAMVIAQYIRNHNPGQDVKNLFTIGPVLEKDGGFLTDIEFAKHRPGQTLLVIYTHEDLRLVPVCDLTSGKAGQIQHLSLTYIPD